MGWASSQPGGCGTWPSSWDGLINQKLSMYRQKLCVPWHATQAPGKVGELQWDRENSELIQVLLPQEKCSYVERFASWGQTCGDMNKGVWQVIDTPGSVSLPCSQGG